MSVWEVFHFSAGGIEKYDFNNTSGAYTLSDVDSMYFSDPNTDPIANYAIAQSMINDSGTDAKSETLRQIDNFRTAVENIDALYSSGVIESINNDTAKYIPSPSADELGENWGGTPIEDAMIGGLVAKAMKKITDRFAADDDDDGDGDDGDGKEDEKEDVTDTDRKLNHIIWVDPESKQEFRIYRTDRQRKPDLYSDNINNWVVALRGEGGRWIQSPENTTLFRQLITDWQKLMGYKHKPSEEAILGYEDTSRKQVFKNISDLSWSEAYGEFADTLNVVDPGAYSHIINQGLNKNPLLRTAETHFLMDSNPDYPIRAGAEVVGGASGDWGGDTGYSGSVYGQERLGELQGNPDKNIYFDYLNNFNPSTGESLLRDINDVIFNISNPRFTDTTGEDISIPMIDDAWTMKRYLQRRRFLESDADAALNQQKLAALPILEHTPSAMHGEIASVLSKLYGDWITDTTRSPEDSWLKYARDNKYFGMVPENILTDQTSHTLYNPQGDVIGKK